MDVLLNAYGELELDRSRPAHRRLLETLGRIQAVATSLAEMPATLDEKCSGSQAIRTLLLELRKEALPPEAGRGAVELVDWLELPLDDAPIVVLTGFNEGLLPESVSGHPFLTDALRTRLGPLRRPEQAGAGCIPTHDGAALEGIRTPHRGTPYLPGRSPPPQPSHVPDSGGADAGPCA